MRYLMAFALVGIASCRPSQKSADTSTAITTSAIDTVKPDSTGIPAAALDTTRTKATPTVTKRATATKSTKQPPRTARDTTILGRDSAIITNPRDPRRQLPTVPKKPPQ